VPFLDQEEVAAVRVAAMQRAEQSAADHRERHVDQHCRAPGTPATARSARARTTALEAKGAFVLRPLAAVDGPPGAGAATATLRDSAAAAAAARRAPGRASASPGERKQPSRRLSEAGRRLQSDGLSPGLPPPGVKRPAFNPAAEAARRAAALEFMKRHKSNEAAAEAAHLADSSLKCNLAATFDSDDDDRNVKGM
jgi:hypothetical protein